MAYSGAAGPGDSGPAQCRADGPLDPGRAVIEAVECDSARFVDLAPDGGGIQPTYLVLVEVADERDVTQLSPTEVFLVPELQNAVAYFGERTDSVRVRTRSDRRPAVEEHVAAIREQGSAFEFAGARFDLEVVAG